MNETRTTPTPPRRIPGNGPKPVLTAVQMDSRRRMFLAAAKQRTKRSISDLIRDGIDMLEARETIESHIRASIARNGAEHNAVIGDNGEVFQSARDVFYTWCMRQQRLPRTNESIGQLHPIAPEIFITLETYKLLGFWHVNAMHLPEDQRRDALKRFTDTTLRQREFFVLPETYTRSMFDDNADRVTIYTPDEECIPYDMNKNSIETFGGAIDAVSVEEPHKRGNDEAPPEVEFSDQR